MKPTPFVTAAVSPLFAVETFETFADATMALQPYLRPREPAMSSPWIAALPTLASRRSP